MSEDFTVDCRDCRHFDSSKLRDVGCLGQCTAYTGRGLLDYDQDCCIDFSPKKVKTLEVVIPSD
jgi:hypothetical protein